MQIRTMGMIWRRHMTGSGNKGGHLDMGSFCGGEDDKGALESGCGCRESGSRGMYGGGDKGGRKREWDHNMKSQLPTHHNIMRLPSTSTGHYWTRLELCLPIQISPSHIGWKLSTTPPSSITYPLPTPSVWLPPSCTLALNWMSHDFTFSAAWLIHMCPWKIS